ncbi:MAG TPA: zf-HC2 domain-containing protein [Bryobacteraceae bacterium]|nr:zf-HC2 domain-containing protein [Bryobacteraceae bacterium]
MSNMESRHPGEDQLLRYADGELPARERDQVQSHLAACWQCRTALEELHTIISDCVRYHKTTEDYFPSPPAPWGDIQVRFAQLDAAPGSLSFFQRVKEAVVRFVPGTRRWAPAMAGLLVISLITYQLRNTPTVEAAQLLRKAMVAADAEPSKPRRIQIRTAQTTLVRAMDGQQLARTSGRAQDLAAVEARFTTAGYDWNEPQSARAFSRWRDGLASKRDQVAIVNIAATPCYQVTTTTGSSPIVEASIKLRVNDLYPLETDLEFNDHERISIGHETALASISTKSPPVPAAPPTSPERVLPRAPETVSAADELRVFAALRRLNADLGEPIEVKASASQVLVSGLGIPPRRQRQIEEEVGSLPKVVLQFSDPAAVVPTAEGRAPAPPSVNPEIARLQERMERQLGGRASFEQLADQILDTSEAMLSRIHALRRLADRFPSDTESQLSLVDRQTLRHIRMDHAEVVHAKASEIEQTLKPVLPALGAPPYAPQPAAAGSWQDNTADLFQTARRAESLLAAILGGAANESVSSTLPSQVFASVMELRAKAEAYRSLTAAVQ